MHPLIHLCIVQILRIILEQSKLWFIAYFSRSMPSGRKKTPKPCISLPLFSQNMVSEAKLLFQPQGGALHLSLNRPFIWNITMKAELRPSHHPVQLVLAMMKPLGVFLRPTFTKAAYCGLIIVRSPFESILGSDFVILWVTLKSSPSRCHIVSPHAHQSSHAITSTPFPPDLSKNSVSPASSPTTVARTLSDTHGRSQDAEDWPFWELTKEHKVWRPHKNKGVCFSVCSETANVSSHHKKAGSVLSSFVGSYEIKVESQLPLRLKTGFLYFWSALLHFSSCRQHSYVEYFCHLWSFPTNVNHPLLKLQPGLGFK